MYTYCMYTSMSRYNITIIRPILLMFDYNIIKYGLTTALYEICIK